MQLPLSRRHEKRNRLICLTSILNYDGMAACRLLRIFMTRKALGSLLGVSRASTKPTKMIAEQEDTFWTDCDK